MKKSKLLNKLPVSSQNPLLSTNQFFKYCKGRFNHIGHSEKDFRWLLSFYKKGKFLLPVYSENGNDFYSSFQIYVVWVLEVCRSHSLKPSADIRYKGKEIKFPIINWRKALQNKGEIIKKQTEDFNKLLLLLLKIQDYYLPEVRSDKRVGELRNYNGANVIGGTFFVTKSNVLLCYVQKRRKEFIENSNFNPLKVLSELKFTIEEIKSWTSRLSLDLKNLDPLESWRLLIQYVNYSKRQNLKGNALLAQDFYEITDVLFLFLKDLGKDLSRQGVSDIFDWIDLSPRDEKSKLPHWKERDYGREFLSKPYQMLEFLCNEYDLNPKPRAIIFTEGDEWKAVKKVFDFYGYKTELLGIEFRALGSDKFNYKKWVQFVEYMHEKQVFLFFVVDNENNAKQAKESFRKAFKSNKRLTPHPFLKRQLNPARIKIWGERKKNSSFEEVNFTNSDIKKAFAKQRIIISIGDIDSIRKNNARRKGLIKAMKAEYSITTLDKPKLGEDLVDIMLEKRRRKPAKKRKTPLENFVVETGKMILLNHQPTTRHHQKMNFETGLMG